MNKTIETLVRIMDEERTSAANRMDLLEEASLSKKRRDEEMDRLETSLYYANADLGHAQAKLREQRARVAALPIPRDAEQYLRAISKYVVPAIFERGLDHNGDPIDYEINKIPFIKVVREESGCGLKEAKDMVDAFLLVRKMGV